MAGQSQYFSKGALGANINRIESERAPKKLVSFLVNFFEKKSLKRSFFFQNLPEAQKIFLEIVGSFEYNQRVRKKANEMFYFLKNC